MRSYDWIIEQKNHLVIYCIKMLGHEFKNQNTRGLGVDLATHIIELKKPTVIAMCACGHTDSKQTHGFCNNCEKPICYNTGSQALCSECEIDYCSECVEECKFCDKLTCKLCILKNYTDWSLTGCRTNCVRYDPGMKQN